MSKSVGGNSQLPISHLFSAAAGENPEEERSSREFAGGNSHAAQHPTEIASQFPPRRMLNSDRRQHRSDSNLDSPKALAGRHFPAISQSIFRPIGRQHRSPPPGELQESIDMAGAQRNQADHNTGFEGSSDQQVASSSTTVTLEKPLESERSVKSEKLSMTTSDLDSLGPKKDSSHLSTPSSSEEASRLFLSPISSSGTSYNMGSSHILLTGSQTLPTIMRLKPMGFNLASAPKLTMTPEDRRWEPSISFPRSKAKMLETEYPLSMSWPNWGEKKPEAENTTTSSLENLSPTKSSQKTSNSIAFSGIPKSAKRAPIIRVHSLAKERKDSVDGGEHQKLERDDRSREVSHLGSVSTQPSTQEPLQLSKSPSLSKLSKTNLSTKQPQRKSLNRPSNSGLMHKAKSANRTSSSGSLIRDASSSSQGNMPKRTFSSSNVPDGVKKLSKAVGMRQIDPPSLDPSIQRDDTGPHAHNLFRFSGEEERSPSARTGNRNSRSSSSTSLF